MDIEMLNKVSEQVRKCQEKYGDYASLHESWAVLQEETTELMMEIFKKKRNFERIEAEIIDCLTVLVRMYDFAKTRNDR